MTTTSLSMDGASPGQPLHSISPRLRQKRIPHNILGTSLFVFVEVMFFTGLLSAYIVIKAGSGAWVPPGEITLPVLVTGFNTLILLLSGVHLFVASRSFANFEKRGAAVKLLMRSMMLGLFFVGFQGYEWVQLVSYGMTMTSGIFAASFFLLIGSHAVHALSAIIAMVWLIRKGKRGRLRQDHLVSLEIYWYFIVGIWPILYGLVYF